jgi:hypothetical protein
LYKGAATALQSGGGIKARRTGRNLSFHFE